MILSDKDIYDRIDEIFDCNMPIKSIQPASVDLRLGEELVFLNGEKHNLYNEGAYWIKPKEFVLGSTLEYVKMPLDLVGIVNGKSSLGRLGLMVHITAGYIDPNFKGNITLELFNVSNEPIKLEMYDYICQIIFEKLTSEPIRPYGDGELNSHYQYDKGTHLSRRRL